MANEPPDIEEFSRQRVAQLLGVDEVSVGRNSLSPTISVRVRIGSAWLATEVEMGSLASANMISGKLAALAQKLRDQVDISKARGEQIDRAASFFGMSAEQLAPTNEFRCERCGHPSTMHGRDRGLACAIYGCDCLIFVSPLPPPSQRSQASEPARPARPMTRFEAIAEELKKL